jgi:CheY-like chemotaxis protein
VREDGESAGRREIKARILLVEDDDANRTILGEFFRMRGFSVEEAASGPEALAFASSSLHDLIVLDVQLPGMDGLEVLARLRATGKPIPPVLALTALAMEGDRERILAAGADAYLSKPAPLAVLGKEVDRLLATRRT